MPIGHGAYKYEWINNWACIPDTPSGRNNGRTHGISVLDDVVIVFAQMVPGVLFYDTDGKLIRSWGDRFVGAHGLAISKRGDNQALWLVDQESCEVCKVTLDGDLLMRLVPPL